MAWGLYATKCSTYVFELLSISIIGHSVKDFAMEVIKSTHEHWKALLQKSTNSGEIEW